MISISGFSQIVCASTLTQAIAAIIYPQGGTARTQTQPISSRETSDCADILIRFEGRVG